MWTKSTSHEFEATVETSFSEKGIEYEGQSTQIHVQTRGGVTCLAYFPLTGSRND